MQVGLAQRNPTQPKMIFNNAEKISFFMEQFDESTDTVCHEVAKLWSNLPLRRMIYETIRRMINYQVVDLLETSQFQIKELQSQSLNDIRQNGPIIKLSGMGHSQHNALKRFLKVSRYRHCWVYRMSLKAGKIISSLFTIFMDDIRLLPKDVPCRAGLDSSDALSSEEREKKQARISADYFACMTDRFAI